MALRWNYEHKILEVPSFDYQGSQIVDTMRLENTLAEWAQERFILMMPQQIYPGGYLVIQKGTLVPIEDRVASVMEELVRDDDIMEIDLENGELAKIVQAVLENS